MCIITCGYQTFHYSDKVLFSLKDATRICSLLSIRKPQILMRKPGTMTLHIQFNTHVHQVYKYLFSFQDTQN